MRVLGINAIFRHPMPALVADGQIDAAAEELLGLPSHGKPAVPFPVGQPERATWWCDFAGSDRDAVAHWHHAASTHPAAEFRLHDWSDDPLGPTSSARRRPRSTYCTGLAALVRHVPDHAEFAAAASLCAVPAGLSEAELGRRTC